MHKNQMKRFKANKNEDLSMYMEMYTKILN